MHRRSLLPQGKEKEIDRICSRIQLPRMFWKYLKSTRYSYYVCTNCTLYYLYLCSSTWKLSLGTHLWHRRTSKLFLKPFPYFWSHFLPYQDNSDDWISDFKFLAITLWKIQLVTDGRHEMPPRSYSTAILRWRYFEYLLKEKNLLPSHDKLDLGTGKTEWLNFGKFSFHPQSTGVINHYNDKNWG